MHKPSFARLRSHDRTLLASKICACFMLTLVLVAQSEHSMSPRFRLAATVHTHWSPPLPVSLKLLADFDPPSERWLAGHRGVDLAAAVDSPVRAAGAGVVHFVGKVVDRPVVSISHGNLRTTYEPVKSDLTKGQSVAAGQIIGTIAEGGHCDSRCLHWGLLRGEEYLNPLALLKGDPPILKPPT